MPIWSEYTLSLILFNLERSGKKTLFGLCVCVCVGGGGGERERERERGSVGINRNVEQQMAKQKHR